MQLFALLLGLFAVRLASRLATCARNASARPLPRPLAPRPSLCANHVLLFVAQLRLQRPGVARLAISGALVRGGHVLPRPSEWLDCGAPRPEGAAQAGGEAEAGEEGGEEGGGEEGPGEEGGEEGRQEGRSRQEEGPLRQVSADHLMAAKSPAWAGRGLRHGHTRAKSCSVLLKCPNSAL